MLTWRDAGQPWLHYVSDKTNCVVGPCGCSPQSLALAWFLGNQAESLSPSTSVLLSVAAADAV